MNQCIACRKKIRQTQAFSLISLGVPSTDGSGWIIKNLIQFHVDCAMKNPVVADKFEFLLGDQFVRMKVASSKIAKSVTRLLRRRSHYRDKRAKHK